MTAQSALSLQCALFLQLIERGKLVFFLSVRLLHDELRVTVESCEHLLLPLGVVGVDQLLLVFHELCEAVIIVLALCRRLFKDLLRLLRWLGILVDLLLQLHFLECLLDLFGVVRNLVSGLVLVLEAPALCDLLFLYLLHEFVHCLQLIILG